MDPDNLAHSDIFFVLAIQSFLLVRLRLAFRGSRTLKIPILFKVTIRRVPVVFCELAIVDGLGEIFEFRFRKLARKYFRRKVISNTTKRTQWKLTSIEVRD